MESTFFLNCDCDCDYFTHHFSLPSPSSAHISSLAICIYVANGMKWEANIKPFCRWSLHYDLWLKLHYFGDFIRKADEETPVSKLQTT